MLTNFPRTLAGTVARVKKERFQEYTQVTIEGWTLPHQPHVSSVKASHDHQLGTAPLHFETKLTEILVDV